MIKGRPKKIACPTSAPTSPPTPPESNSPPPSSSSASSPSSPSKPAKTNSSPPKTAAPASSTHSPSTSCTGRPRRSSATDSTGPPVFLSCSRGQSTSSCWSSSCWRDREVGWHLHLRGPWLSGMGGRVGWRWGECWFWRETCCVGGGVRRRGSVAGSGRWPWSWRSLLLLYWITIDYKFMSIKKEILILRRVRLSYWKRLLTE